MNPPWLPEVVGDPAGMRALAGVLRAEASTLALRRSYLEETAKGVVFEAPAGNEFRARLSTWNDQTDGVVQELLGTASLLERSASEVEALLAERARRLEQLAESARSERSR
jgi:hypothetical protein